MNTNDDLREVITNILLNHDLFFSWPTDKVLSLRDDLYSTLTQTYEWRHSRGD